MWNKLRQKLDLPESYISITLGLLVVIVAGILSYNYFVKNQIELPGGQKTNGDQELTEEMPELPAQYTVTAGDDLWKIAVKHYNSGYNWATIAKANNISDPDHIEAGQKLTIPEAEAIKPEGDISAAETAVPKEYTVTKGDSLWNIAEREYGSGYEWVRIAQANNLANPDVIHTGNLLQLPQ